jgi:hypothetical protein
LKVITIVVLVGTLKIYVTTIKALKKYIWNPVYPINWWFKKNYPLLNVNVFFARVFNLTLRTIKLKVQVLCFPYFMDNFIVYVFICFFKGVKSIFFLKLLLWLFYLKNNNNMFVRITKWKLIIFKFMIIDIVQINSIFFK